MNVNNLTNVYNQNPTLQGQYTLQQYLDLYGGSSTTSTTTPTTSTSTSTPASSGQGIINANINQFQNQGGGGGGGPTPTKGFRRDDNLGTSDYQGAGKGFKQGLKDAASDTFDFITSGGITGSLLRSIFGKKKKDFSIKSNKIALKARDKLEAERKAKAQAIKDAQIAKDFYAGHGRTTNPGGRLGGNDGQSGGQFSGGAGFASANAYGGSGNMNDLGADNFRRGGRVGAKDGGSMIQIVKDRLMEKNPAMWGIGYEGLASLQDLIMSMPFNQGGIVNIRRK